MTDLTIHRGEAKSWQGTLVQNGALVPLTSGDALYFAMRKSYPSTTITDDSDAEISKSTGTGDGMAFTSLTDIVFSVDFTKSDTVSLAPGRYYWEIKYKPSGADPIVIGGGIMTIISDVVRAV